MEQNIIISNSYLTFPVIKKSKRKITLMQGIISLIVGIMIIYLIMYKTQFNEQSTKNILSAILFVLCIIIIIAVNFLLQKFKFGGEFTITDDKIILTTTNKTATFKLNEITNLKMICISETEMKKDYKSFKKWLFGNSDEKTNYVEFLYNGQYHMIEIYLKNNKETQQFKQRAKELQADNKK
jgi:hypothetical protein